MDWNAWIDFNRSVPAVHVWQKESAFTRTLCESSASFVPNWMCASCITSIFIDRLGRGFSECGLKDSLDHSICGCAERAILKVLSFHLLSLLRYDLYLPCFRWIRRFMGRAKNPVDLGTLQQGTLLKYPVVPNQNYCRFCVLSWRRGTFIFPSGSSTN